MTNDVRALAAGILELAGKATPGPWHASDFCQSPATEKFPAIDTCKVRPLQRTALGSFQRADAEYIAACSPDVITKLAQAVLSPATTREQLEAIRPILQRHADDELYRENWCPEVSAKTKRAVVYDVALKAHQDRGELIKQLLSPAATAVLSPGGANYVADELCAERERQKSVEGWTVDHDNDHVAGELALAAGAYAVHAGDRRDFRRSVHPDDNKVDDAVYVPRAWPHSWAARWWKPKDPRRDLIRAGALIMAEIERLDRASGHKAPTPAPSAPTQVPLHPTQPHHSAQVDEMMGQPHHVPDARKMVAAPTQAGVPGRADDDDYGEGGGDVRGNLHEAEEGRAFRKLEGISAMAAAAQPREGEVAEIEKRHALWNERTNADWTDELLKAEAGAAHRDRWTLLTLLRQRPAQGQWQWQTMESAPHTDHMKPILIYWRSCGWRESYYGVDEGFDARPEGWPSPAEGWRTPGDGCIPRNQEDAVAWQPMPTAPAQAQQETGNG